MGGPVDMEAIRPFLLNLFSDNDIIQFPRFMRPWQGTLARRIAEKRTPYIGERYKEIGGGSPIVPTTLRLAANVEKDLKARGIDARVVTAMRYCEPTATTALKELKAAGVREILLVTLYPHFSRSTTGSSAKDFHLARKALGWKVPVRLIPAWGTDPGYLALTERDIREALAKVPKDLLPRTHLVFSPHGIPQRYADGGDPYGDQVRESYDALRARFPEVAGTHLCFQSKVGPLPWLKPYTDEYVGNLMLTGVESIVTVPLGFVSDHIETLYDMDINFRTIALEGGARHYGRVRAFNDDPAFARVLSDLVQRQVSPTLRR